MSNTRDSYSYTDVVIVIVTMHIPLFFKPQDQGLEIHGILYNPSLIGFHI